MSTPKTFTPETMPTGTHDGCAPSAPPSTSRPDGSLRTGRPHRESERGVALMIVMLMAMVLIPFTAEFAFQIDMEAKTAHNVTDQLMIDYAIEGQYQVMLGRFEQDGIGNESDSYDDVWNDDELLSRTEEGTSVQLTTHVFDERSKMNLRMLSDGTPEKKAIWKERMTALVRLYRAETDWDATGFAEEFVDDVRRYMSGEGRGTIPKPKTIDDRAMLLIDELTFVNELVEKHQLLFDRREGERSAHGLHRYLTLQGDGRINLNTASLTVLKAMFPLNEEVAEAIIDRREGSAESDTGVTSADSSSSEEGAGNPFTDINQVMEIDGVTQQVLRANKVVLQTDFDVTSHFFSVRIRATTEQSHREEAFFLERVPGQDPNGKIQGFRHLVCQERTDPLEEGEEEGY